MINPTYKICIFVFFFSILFTPISFAIGFDLVSENLPTGDMSGVVFNDEIAYFATGYGLQVMDFSDLLNPDIIAMMPTPGLCKGVELDPSGDYVYLADGDNGLLVVEVSNPSDPQVIAQLDLPGFASYIEWCDDNIVVCLGEDGLAFVDCMDPTEPLLVDIYDAGSRALSANFSDGYVYVAGLDRLTSFEVDLFELTEVQQENETFFSVCLNDGLMYVSTNDGVDVLDLNGSGTWDPTPVTTLELDTPTHLYPINEYIAVANGNEVAIIDWFEIIGSVETSDNVSFVYFAGELTWFDCLIACEGVYGFEILDVTNPEDPLLFASFPFPGGPRNIEVANIGGTDYAFLAFHLGGVLIMDVSDPSDPIPVSQIEFPATWTYDVALIGEALFICNWHDGLYVYEISNILNPVELYHYEIETPGSRAIDVCEEYLILVHNTEGILKFDLSNIANPTLLGQSIIDGEPRDVRLRDDDIAFAASYLGGCGIFDVSGEIPIQISNYGGLSRVRACDFVDEHTYYDDILFVGSEDGGMDIVDISNIYAPTFVANYQSAGDVNGLLFHDEGVPFVALFDWEDGIEIVNVTDPENPFLDDYHDTYGLAKSGYIYDGCLYAADSYSLLIFESYNSVGDSPSKSMPDDYALLGNFPNPFNPVTNLTFHMKIAGNAAITVYNVTGRQVVIVTDDLYSAGVHEVQFDGSELPSGTYFAEFKVEDFSQVRKIVLLK